MTTTELLAPEAISLRIATVRGQRVILDADLAALYEVPTKRFNEAVKRNAGKFSAGLHVPALCRGVGGFKVAVCDLRRPGRARAASQVPAPCLHRARRHHAANLLTRPRAVGVSAYVVRAFVRLRELAATHQDLAKRLGELEEKTEALATQHDTFSRDTRNQLRQVFDALRELMTPPEPAKRPIGFVTHEEKNRPADKKASSTVAKRKKA